MDDDDRLIAIYTAQDPLEAHFLRHLLQDHGIRSQVMGERLGLAIGDIPHGWSTSPRLWVMESSAQPAQRLIDDWQAARRLRKQAETSPNGQVDDAPDDGRLISFLDGTDE